MESTLSAGHSLWVVFSGHVVHSSSLRILQQLISVDDFLEFFLGSWVLLVSIGVVFFRSLFESLFDLLLCGIFRNAQDFIRIGTLGLYFGHESDESDNKKDQILDDFHITCELNIKQIKYRWHR